MAAHLQGQEVQLSSSPLSLQSYRDGGMVIPMCRWPDGTVTRDSFAIMRELEKRTDGPTRTQGLDAQAQGKLERLFFAYALDRVGGLKTFRFALAWARMPRGNGPLWASSFRAFMFLYFLILILVGRNVSRKYGHSLNHSEKLRSSLAPWTSILSGQPFLSGESPGFLDCALLGHVQCMVTGLTDHTIPILKEEPALQAWIARMEEALEGYSHSFLSRIRNPDERPAEARFGDVILFWMTLLVLVGLFPITLIALADAFRRRTKNTARSGAKIRAPSRE